jgi:hypothetical protein
MLITEVAACVDRDLEASAGGLLHRRLPQSSSASRRTVADLSHPLRGQSRLLVRTANLVPRNGNLDCLLGVWGLDETVGRTISDNQGHQKQIRHIGGFWLVDLSQSGVEVESAK